MFCILLIQDSKIGNSIEDTDEYQKTSIENADNRDQDADCLAQSNYESDAEKDDDYDIKTFLRSGDDRFSHIVSIS